MRFAYTESILRPSYSPFAPNRVIGDDSDEQGGLVFISGGNPELEPYRSQNVDFYIEKYLPHRGLLSFGLFAKRIDDPIFGATQELDGAAFGFPNSRVRLSGPLNGSNGEIQGFEATYSQQFGFLPSPWDGFGVQLNYTYSDDDAETPALFNQATGLNDGASRNTVSRAPRTRPTTHRSSSRSTACSARVSYQYRSEWLNAIDLGEPQLDRFWDERPRWMRPSATRSRTTGFCSLTPTTSRTSSGDASTARPRTSTKSKASDALFLFGVRANL